MWNCKKCGGNNFETVETKSILSTNLVFDKEGFIEMDYDCDSSIAMTLSCADCNNLTIGLDIENIAEWKDDDKR